MIVQALYCMTCGGCLSSALRRSLEDHRLFGSPDNRAEVEYKRIMTEMSGMQPKTIPL